MKDYYHLALQWIDHNRHTLSGFILVMIASFLLLGCQVTTKSLIIPNKKITQNELTYEITTLQTKLDKQRNKIETELANLSLDSKSLSKQVVFATDDLQKKLHARSQFIESIGGIAIQAASGQFNPTSVIATLLSMLAASSAIGTAADNRRKNRIIKKLKTNTFAQATGGNK